MKRVVVAKNLVLKIQNLVMNNKSQPIKSNPGIMYIYCYHTSLSFINELFKIMQGCTTYSY